MSVVIETTYGDITVDLFTEERPIACLNFIKLCKLKYYNFNLFHTVERGFIAQTGDPTGAGDGGISVWGVLEGIHKRFFEAEYLPKIYHSSAGLLSLVSAGKNLVGSQFFFTLGTDLTSLDGVHCVIGEVVEGEEILRKLNEAIVDEKFRPYQDIRITHTVVLNDPFPDPRAFQVPNRSPSPSAERLQNGRIAADEDIDDTGGKTIEEIQEMLAEREAKARATILEIVGDLPDADMAPPENVLFVCKLNPVTTDDDLEIIFSRFGKVQNCEVIRDRKSGDSLQYAFVEFEDQKSCEAAYFKMDNVLIDDRRIHVDFSQSVSKVKWRGKGRGVEGPDGRIDFNNLKDAGNREQRGGRRNESRERDRMTSERDKMTSEERRSAREARHKEQELARNKNRSRSKSRNRGQYDERRRSEYGGESYRNRRTEDSRDNSYRSRYDSRNQNSQRRRYSRSRSAERSGRRYVDKRNSPERRPTGDRHSPDRRRLSPDKRQDFPDERYRAPDRRRHSPERRRNSPDPRNTVDRRRQLEPSTEEQKNGSGKKNKLKRKKDEKQKKAKKSKKHVSSDDNSSSSDETESESEETKDSTSESTSTASSSEDERHKKRKKKSKKTKKNKKTKSKKKSKKHKK